MKKQSKLILLLFGFLTLVGLAGATFAKSTGIDPLLAKGALGVGLTALAIQSYGQQVYHVAAIQQEIWVNYIIGNLFKDNEFMTKCFDENEYVLNGSVVHIPQAGAKPTVVKNRSSFPATAVRRTDTDVTYALDVYSTDPTHITNAEQKEISYDKIDSVLSEHVSSLRESFADDLLYKWAVGVTAANIVRTSGTAVATALAPSATGTRNKFMKEDLKSAQKMMDKMNISKEERYALLDTDSHSQLMEDTSLIVRDGMNGNEVDLKNGIVGRLYGFAIMTRSSVLVADNAGTPVIKAPGAAGAATDNLVNLCWQKNAVAKALGSSSFFENQKDALYYGDIYSAEVKMGGRRRRANAEGVVAIIQQ